MMLWNNTADKVQ